MKKILSYLSVGFAGLFAMFGVNSAHAAADPDLVAAVASTTGLLTDNKGTIIGWIFAVFTFVIVISLIKRLLHRGKKAITRAV
jgi:acid phosphatase family membrane protein YuiD